MKFREQAIQVRKESADAILAKNLVAARVTAGLTQQDLAIASDISRATIAQLETGCSDPRLSTIVDLARALGISPMLLLIGPSEARALAELPQRVANAPLSLPAADVVRMRGYVASGMLKDRLRAAALGATIARDASRSGETSSRSNDPGTADHGTAVGSSSAAVWIWAAVLSAILPGEGTAIGAAVGQLLIEQETTSSPVLAAGQLDT